MRRVLLAALLLVSAVGAPTASASSGSFDRLWGAGVLTGNANTFEICSVAANCQAGASSSAIGGGFSGPAAVADGADGNVYVADALNNRVQVFDGTTGAFVRAFGWGVDPARPGALGTCTTAASCLVGAQGGPGGHLNEPRGIAVGPNGDVYVSEARGDRLSEFTASGAFVRLWGVETDSAASGDGFQICPASDAAHCTLGLAGGSTGGNGGGFDYPQGVAVDSTGAVWVVDYSNYRLEKFSATGQFQFTIGGYVNNDPNAPDHNTCSISAECKSGGQIPAGSGFHYPVSVAVGPGDTVYVGDYERVDEFSSSGVFQRAWGLGVNGGTSAEVCTVAANCGYGQYGETGGEFTGGVTGIAVDGTGHVYAGDEGRIQRFDADGAWQAAWGKNVDAAHPGVFGVCIVAASCAAGIDGSLGGELSGNTGLATGTNGELFVADQVNERIVRYAPSGASAPAAPTLSTVTPTPPSAENHPVISGSAAAGSTVSLYDNAACTGTPLVAGTAAAFASPGLTITVADDTTTTVYGTASTADGTSVCSTSSLTYQEVSGPPVTQVHFSAATASVPEAAGDIQLPVQRTGDTTGTTTVHYATVAGTAIPFTINGGDYVDTTGTLTFAPGDTAQTITVPIIGDGLVEGPETFSVVLSNPSARAEVDAPGSVTVTIIDDDVIDTTITGGPDGPTNSATPAFTYTATPPDGATFRCWVDDAAPAACNGGALTVSPLTDGSHTFHVVATDSSGDTDRSPATRTFSVDTTPPVPDPHVVVGAAVSTGVYTGNVEVVGTAHDPDPGSGVSASRCALDPATPPTRFAELSDACDLSATTPGTHVFYEMSQDTAGNVSPVASVTFRIVPVPVASITSGPTGLTVSAPYVFGYVSTVAGSTFECRVDGAAFAACGPTSTYTSFANGGHTFQVRAISPDGVTSAAVSREFTVGSISSTQHCGGLFPFGDPVSLVHDYSLGGADCNLALPPCPAGSACTLRMTDSVTDQDIATPWDIDGSGDFMRGQIYLAGTYNLDCFSTPAEAHKVYDWLDGSGPHPDYPACPRTSTPATALGPATVVAGCNVERTYIGAGYDAPGPDDARSYSCTATMTIAPAAAFTLITAGGPETTILVPGAGTVNFTDHSTGLKLAGGARGDEESIGAGPGPGPGPSRATGGPDARAARASKATSKKKSKTKPPAFTAIHQTVSAAGPLDLTFKLRTDLKKQLKHKPVPLKADLTFTPAGGGAPTHLTESITLTPIPKQVTPPKPKVSKRCAENFRSCKR